MPVSSLPDRAVTLSATGWARLIQANRGCVHPADQNQKSVREGLEQKSLSLFFEAMQAFAQLLDRLTTEPRLDAREQLLIRYFQETPDPDRGLVAAVLTGAIDLKRAKPALLKALIDERVDERLFALSHDFVGDLSETVALVWPRANAEGAVQSKADCCLAKLLEQLEETGKTDIPQVVSSWMDRLDDTGRWAFLKLVTGGLKEVVPPKLVKSAIARLGILDPLQVEEAWHGSKPPYVDLFDWVEGKTGPPVSDDPALYRPVMQAQPFGQIVDRDQVPATDYAFEWKWDGLRVQASSGQTAQGDAVRRLFNKSGDDISSAFPEIIEALTFDACIDGELLIKSGGQVQPYSDLQKREKRKKPGPKLVKDFPAVIRAYDLLSLDGKDLRSLPFRDRRKLLASLHSSLANDRIELSPLLTVDDWETVERTRSNPLSVLETHEANAVDGVMLKNWGSHYVAGRATAGWYKWKKEPHLIDAVLMYAERGRGELSALHANFTVGVWRGTDAGMELVPVGKAGFGVPGDDLAEIDNFVRSNTTDRFGPVREVAHEAERGLVLEVAFESLIRSSRRKSGIELRTPKIIGLRKGKLPREADWITVIEALLPQ